ncbi:MAG: hypothetical protein ACYDG3_14515 [Bacillati bacterium]
MGCEEMLDVIEKEINTEITEFAHRRNARAISGASRIDTFGLNFVTNDVAMKAFQNFNYIIHIKAFREKMVEECNFQQRLKKGIENPTAEEAARALSGLFG